MLQRSYYSVTVPQFISHDPTYILGELASNNQFDLTELQRNTWIEQIAILKSHLGSVAEGHILFEYTIPRVGKRIDNVLIYRGIVFLFEFKVGEKAYRHEALEQALDYALDLKNFHKESLDRVIAPLLVATDAPPVEDIVTAYPDRVLRPLRCNRGNIWSAVRRVCAAYECEPLDAGVWENSVYMPTPTIIEAAQALYRGHSVEAISRSDAGAINLNLTAHAINTIIEESKRGGRKSICFVTGVPGAGKTLAGLNIANERHRFDEDEHAVFLSGNGPLVVVLQEALARNEVATSRIPITKTAALKKSKAFIQNIHHFRDNALSQAGAPLEKVVIFDEAQRAWNERQTSDFMRRKRGQLDFAQSEPEFLISVMDRHHGWAVIICLVGGGQEINTGEAGLPEWFDALRRRFSNWQVFLSERLSDSEYTRGRTNQDLVRDLHIQVRPELHLAVSLRSFRSEKVSQFVKALLDRKTTEAAELYKGLADAYPIVLTRSASRAREWVRSKARGTERFGLIASSGARRLKPVGIWVQSEIEATNWFLNDPTDVRASCFLEDVATEFDIQGLELDWTMVAWDADFRFANPEWEYGSFIGSRWNRVNSTERQFFMKNAYRVLLTRARQGMVIYVPQGDPNDPTRKPAFYDQTYQYLKQIGIRELDPCSVLVATKQPDLVEEGHWSRGPR